MITTELKLAFIYTGKRRRGEVVYSVAYAQLHSVKGSTKVAHIPMVKYEVYRNANNFQAKSCKKKNFVQFTSINQVRAKVLKSRHCVVVGYLRWTREHSLELVPRSPLHLGG